MKITSYFSCLLLFVGLTACEDKGATPDPGVQAASAEDKAKDEVDVYVKEAKPEAIFETLSFGGFLRSVGSFQIVSEVDGVVTKVMARTGQKVKRGQTLFTVRQDGMGLSFKTYAVKSSATGKVLTLPPSVGSRVRKGDPLVEVSGLRRLSVTFYSSFNDLADIKIDSSAEVVVGAGTAREASKSAKVVAIAPAADSKTGTYPIRVEFACDEDCSQTFRPGEFARVNFRRNERQGFVVPLVSLNRKRDNLYHVDQEGKVQKIKVTVGLHLGDRIEVTSGIKEGMTIVTKYAKDPKEGQVAKILQPKERSVIGKKKEQTPAG